jgi:glutamine amidotransferase
MGWNQLEIKKQSPLLKNINNGDFVYFVHSYMAKVKNLENILAITNYGEEVTAIVGNGNVYGCQFHPEKSSSVGVSILKNFTEMLYGEKV